LIVIPVTFVAPPESLNFTLNVQTLLTPVTGFGLAVAVTFEAVPPAAVTDTCVVPLDPPNVVDPPYVAVIVSVPTASDAPDTVNVATPDTSDADPRFVVPDVNVTVPVGVVVPDAGFTVAVNTVVAFCANDAGFGDTVVVVAVVGPAVTDTCTDPLEPPNVADPPYDAITVSVPTASRLPGTVTLATPPDSEAEPSVVAPDVNVTVPVGVVVPDAGFTVAVSKVELFCANVVGFAETVVEVPVLDDTEPDHPVASAFTSSVPSPVTMSYPAPAE
jgi:hypothetical protein